MKKIVITGGPCAGKTTVIEAIKADLAQHAVFVPECATLILSGGFPAPPDQKFLGHSKFDNWMRHFQNAIYHTQLALEDLAITEVELENKEMIVCDRGVIDAVAYHPEGVKGFTTQFGTTMTRMHIRYDVVIFLESLAVGKPDLFGRVGNEHRYETVEHAQHVNQLTFDAWKLRSNFHFVSSKLLLEEKIEQVRELLLDAKNG